MNTMVANALLMNSTALTRPSSPQKEFTNEEGKQTFSKMLGRLNDSNEQPSKEKEAPTPLNVQLETLEVAIQANAFIDSDIDYLPNVWKEDFTTAWMQSTEDEMPPTTDWPEGKQLAFLAVSHAVGDTHTKGLISQMIPPEVIENVLRELELLASVSKIREEKEIMLDDLDRQINQSIQKNLLSMNEKGLYEWTEQDVEQAIVNVFEGKGIEQINSPSFNNRNNEGIDQLMRLVSGNSTDSQNKLSIFKTVLTFLKKEQDDLEGKSSNVSTQSFNLVNENRINHSRINTVQPLQPGEAVEIKDSSTIGAESLNNQVVPERLAKPEMVQMYIGDRLPKEMQQQQFLRQLHSILKRGTFIQSPQGAQTLSIKLYPEHLGRLTIQLTQQEGLITARIMSGSSATRDLVESQLTQLRQAFVQQQLQVDRIEVSDETFEQQQDGESSKDDHATKEREAEREEGDSASFQNILNEVTINEQI